MFSRVSVTNYHKPGGLKQLRFALLQLWKPEFQHQFHWAETKVSAGPHSIQRLFRCPFQLPELHSLAHGPFLHFQSQQHCIFKSFSDSRSHCLLPSVISLQIPPLRTLAIVTIQDNLLISKSLITPAKPFTGSRD